MKLFKLWYTEQKENIGLIWKLNLYDFKSQYARHYLGILWIFLMPLLQIGVLWMVFGLGIRGIREDVDEVPFIVYLMTGIFGFRFITGCITGGAGAILSKAGLLTKMQFPSSVLISIKIMNEVITLLLVTVIVFVVSIYNGYTPWFTYFGLIYFIIATVAFTYGVALILSAMIVIVRDIKNLLANVMRLFFFMTPIFWSLNSATPLMEVISAYNPFTFLLMTYRAAFIFEDMYIYGGASNHIYFWTLTAFIFYIGLHVHYKFRDRFVDYMR